MSLAPIETFELTVQVNLRVFRIHLLWMNESLGSYTPFGCLQANSLLLPEGIQKNLVSLHNLGIRIVLAVLRASV